MNYKLIVTGGTFDHFHKGHHEFLRYAFSISQKVLIGLTTDTYAHEKRNSERIETYEVRKRSITDTFKTEVLEDRLEIAPINSVFIPDIWQNYPIEAIFASKETYSGGEAINNNRIASNLPSLPIILFPMILAEDAYSISSTRIRNGTINRAGALYVKKVLFDNTSLLPDKLRAMLQRPFGEITQFQNINFTGIESKNIITVGDVTTKIFLENNIYPKVTIVDFIVEREKKYSSIADFGFKGTETIYHAVSPAGQLTPSLFTALQKIFTEDKENSILLVNGEEDLSVVPVLLYAPLGFHIFYGQPKEGMVHIVVTEKIKEETRKIISEFRTL